MRSTTLIDKKYILCRFGKQRPPKDSDDDEATLIQVGDAGKISRHQSDSESAPVSRAGSQSSLASNADSLGPVSFAEKSRKSCRQVILYAKRFSAL